MRALLYRLGRLGDWLLGGPHPVDLDGRLAPYADPFHLDSRPAAVSPCGGGPGTSSRRGGERRIPHDLAGAGRRPGGRPAHP